MRNVLSILFLLTFAIPQALSKAKVEEELFVVDPYKKYLPLVKSNPNLTIDHVSALGFEVYGPKGTQSLLDSLKINSQNIKMNAKEKSDYPSFTQVEAQLKNLAAKYPNIFKLFSIGKSSQGRDLWVMKISDNVNVDEVEPEVKYISSMHGNEITGRQLLLLFLDELGDRYNKNDPEIRELVDNTEIFIMPSMNPDGSEARTRANANGADLNRDFPDFTTSDNQNILGNREPETKAVMQFQLSRKFSLSANFHGGAEVVNYPWDTTETRHPLDVFVQELSSAYANLVPYLKESQEFQGGITNGYDWYQVDGGMQDWSYNWHNDLQVTVELSNDKWPSFNLIPDFYSKNRGALLEYLKLVHRGAGFYYTLPGVKGIVEILRVENGKEISLGKFPFQNSEFYKVLPNGYYKFKIDGNMFFTTTIDGVEILANPNGNYTKIEL